MCVVQPGQSAQEMNVLVCDVRKSILQQYARSYAPWWGIACKQWQLERSILSEPGHAHNRRCEVLAREGRLGMLQRILEETGDRLYNKTWGCDDNKKRRLLEEAAKEGHVELLRWLDGQWRMTPDMWQIVMMVAARNNHEQVVRLCHKVCGSARMEFALAGAARCGYERLVQLCYNEWIAAHHIGWTLQHDVGWAMREAARGGHVSLVLLCHAWGTANLENVLAGALDISIANTHITTNCVMAYVSDVRDALCCAARGGYVSIIKLCHQWQAANIARVMAYAARIGDTKIVRMCKERIVGTANDAMKQAARGGHEHIVRLCHDHYDGTDVDEAMAQAAWYGHEHIVRICHDEWKATNVNRAMAMAAWGGHEKIVRLCHDEYNANDVADAMHWAARDGHDHVVRLCYAWGATNVRQALEEAVKKEHFAPLTLGFGTSGLQGCDNRGCAIIQGRNRVVALCKQWLSQP